MAHRDSLPSNLLRPIFFIEEIGKYKIPETKIKTPLINTAINTALVANSHAFEPTSPLSVQQQLQNEISCKLMPHIHFTDNFYQEYYDSEKNDQTDPHYYAYRQPIGTQEWLAYFIRQQCRAPLSLISKIQLSHFTPENMTRLWSLLHTLSTKQKIIVHQVMLSHRDDYPRDIVFRDNDYYQQYQSILSSYCEKIPEQQHRCFIFIETCPTHFSQEYFCLVADFHSLHQSHAKSLYRANNQQEILTQCRLIPLTLTTADNRAHRIKQQIPSHYLEADIEWLDTAPHDIFLKWNHNCQRFLRFRHSLTRKLGSQLHQYSLSQQKKHILSDAIENKVEELMQLHQLYEVTLHWLQERQHLSSRAPHVWQLYIWILHRFKKCTYDFLHFGYSFESTPDILAIAKPLLDYYQRH